MNHMVHGFAVAQAIFLKVEATAMMDISKYLTVRQVSKKLDITEEWVRDLIKKKEIKATMIGKWRVNPEDLDEFIKMRSNR